MRFIRAIIIASAIVAASCGDMPFGASQETKQEVTDFANAYFNYDFKTALEHCTPESRKWIEFSASNVHETDLDQIRRLDEGTKVEVAGFDFDSNDSTGTATVVVTNYLHLGIGEPSEIVDKAKFRLPIVKRGEKWTVKMEGLPRSGTRGRGSI